MMRKTTFIIAMTIALAASSAKAGNGPTTAPSGDAGKLIVRVVGRDSTIVARSSANGPSYSVESKYGTTTAKTLPQLQASNPELAKKIQSSSASARTAWAGMDMD